MTNHQASLVGLLNRILEAERAEIVAIDRLLATVEDRDLREALMQLKLEGAWICMGLYRAVHGEGGIPSTRTTDLAKRLKAEDGRAAKLALLHDGRAGIERDLEEALSLGSQGETRTHLMAARQRHKRKTKALARLARAGRRKAGGKG